MKFIVVFLFTIFVSTNICFAAYHEANILGNELATTTATGTVTSSLESQLKFPDEESGKLKDELNNLDSEGNEIVKSTSLFDFGSIYFWVMIISLFLILIILLNMFRKLSKIKKIVKNYKSAIIPNRVNDKIDESKYEDDVCNDEEEDDFIQDDNEEEEELLEGDEEGGVIEGDNKEELIDEEDIKVDSSAKPKEVKEDDEIIYN